MATEEGEASMQEAVHIAAEEAGRREREAADRRVLAAEKDVLLQSQMCALYPGVFKFNLTGTTECASACSGAWSLVPGVFSPLGGGVSTLPEPAAGGCRRRREGMKRREALCATGWPMHLQGIPAWLRLVSSDQSRQFCVAWLTPLQCPLLLAATSTLPDRIAD